MTTQSPHARQDTHEYFKVIGRQFPICYISTLDLLRSYSARAIQKTLQLLEKPEHEDTKWVHTKENHAAKTQVLDRIVWPESRAAKHRGEAARVLQLIIPQRVSN